MERRGKMKVYVIVASLLVLCAASFTVGVFGAEPPIRMGGIVSGLIFLRLLIGGKE
jgi:hypothetical protein